MLLLVTERHLNSKAIDHVLGTSQAKSKAIFKAIFKIITILTIGTILILLQYFFQAANLTANLTSLY